MATNSGIEWTEATWNPVTGCTRVSAGCDNCYAAQMSKRLAAMGQEKYQGLVGNGHFNGQIKLHEDALSDPLKRRKPTVYFVNSMSDLFHPSVPFEFIGAVYKVMATCRAHTFQVLTKRPERAAEFYTWLREHVHEVVHGQPDIGGKGDLSDDAAHGVIANALRGITPRNIWIGTSVEDQHAADERIPWLLKCPAAVRFLSCEPLLGAVDIMHRVLFAGEYYCPTCMAWSDSVGKQVACEQCHRIYGQDELHDECPECGENATEVSCPRCGNFGFDHGLESSEVWAREIKAALPELIHWVITGGESGPKARPCDLEWIRSLVEQCRSASVPCFVKQLGSNPVVTTYDFGRSYGDRFEQVSVNDEVATKDRKGGDPSEWPEDLQIREVPSA